MTERNGSPAGPITCMPKVWGHWRFSNNQRQENGSNLMAWPKLFRQRIREVWGKSVEHCFTEMCRICPTIQRPEKVRKSSGMWHKVNQAWEDSCWVHATMDLAGNAQKSSKCQWRTNGPAIGRPTDKATPLSPGCNSVGVPQSTCNAANIFDGTHLYGCVLG